MEEFACIFIFACDRPKRWDEHLERPHLDYSEIFEEDVGQIPGKCPLPAVVVLVVHVLFSLWFKGVEVLSFDNCVSEVSFPLLYGGVGVIFLSVMC